MQQSVGYTSCIKSNMYKQIRNYFLNGKPILREKALSGKEAYAQIEYRKIKSNEKKCPGCTFVKSFQGLSKLIY